MAVEETTSIQLPPGMSKEVFEKAFATFQKTRIATAIRDKAVRSATKDLIAAHKPEYDRLVKLYTPAS